jgi:alpha-beta hydrolase superfamily lysophospholipase
VAATPLWLGPPPRRLFGWFHTPESGVAKGTAVLCAPLGKEASNAMPAMQALCAELVDHGVAALRFAYAGTGDSVGRLDDPDRVPEWLASIDDSVRWARAANPGPVVLVGTRMGALLAAEAVRRGTEVDGLVQWDPCPSGRDFLRIERTLLATGYGATQLGDGSISGPAFTYSPETVQGLSALRLSPPGTPTTLPTLVLARGQTRSLSEAKATFSASTVEWVEVDGQPELIDVPPDMIILPSVTIKAIAEWVGDAVEGPEAPVGFEALESSVVAHAPDGRAICEHPVWLGPNALFGMVTDPGVPEDPGSPTLVFLSAGALDHTGPGRMWVDLARQFAVEGIRSIRVDLDGIGETFGRPDQARQIPKPPEAIDDVADIAQALGDPEGRNLVLVGLSSGAYHAIEAGLRLHPRGVCAINPGLSSWVPEMDQGFIDPRRLAHRPMPKALRTLAVEHSRIANWIWRALLQVWVKGSATDAVAGVSRRGTAVLLVTSEADAQQFEPSAYWSTVRRRLHRRNLLDVEVVAGSDHSLYTVEGRKDAIPILTRWILWRYGAQPGAG